MDGPFDAEFLELASRDDDAFAVIKRRFQKLVWASSYGFGFDRHTRDDVAQLVWLKLFQNLTSIRDPSRLAGWLATTTRRECLRVVKARARFTLIESFEDDADTTTTSKELDTAIIKDETVRLVAQALNSLDAECRQLLRLLSAEPALTYGEIAETLKAAPGSIGPWRQRCLRKLAARPEIRAAIGGSRRLTKRSGE
ncbi:MAG TPA: RNA polymerase sigma factor [Ilumatobacter sp.]